MGYNLQNTTSITTLSSKVKFINRHNTIVTINLYDNKRLFPDFDGGDYIAVNTSNGVGYMYCSSTLYTTNYAGIDVTTANLAFTFKDRNGNLRYVYTKQPKVSETLVTTLTTAVTDYSAITQEDFPCGGAIYVSSCRGKNGSNGGNGGAGGAYADGAGGSGGKGGAGGNGWNVYFAPCSNWDITGNKSEDSYTTSFDLYTAPTYGGGGGGGGGGGQRDYVIGISYGAGAGGLGGECGYASPMPPGARVLFPSKTDVVITTTKRAGAAGANGLNGETGHRYDNDGGAGGAVTGYVGTVYGGAGGDGTEARGGYGGYGATYNYAWDIHSISSTYNYKQVNGVLSITPTSDTFASMVTSTSGIVITKFTAYYSE